MAVELIHSEKGTRPMGETVVINRHLYLTEDKQRVVEENDPAARWLWASPGQEVSRAQAEFLGAVAPAAPAAAEEAAPEEAVVETAEAEPADDEPAKEPEPEVKTEPKRRQPSANKARTRPADK